MDEGRLIFDGKYIRATAFEVAEPRGLVALFDHRRREPGFPVASRSLFLSRNGFSQVKITVSRPDFFLNPDLDRAREALRRYARRFARVTAMGFSMGGFGCLVFARAMRFDRMLLVSPQRPKFPEFASPGHMDAEAEAAFFAHPGGRLAGLPPHLSGTVLFDPWFHHGRDRAYARILARLLPGLTLAAIPGGGHPASSILTRADQVYLLQRLFIKPQFSPSDFRKLHRKTRKSDAEYRDSVATWRAARDAQSGAAGPGGTLQIGQAA